MFDKDVKNKVEELLAKMTLEQKVGQIVQAERMSVTPEEVTKYHLGSILSGGGSVPGNNELEDWVAMNEEYWQASMSTKHDNIPIPIMYGIDAIHGNTNIKGATVFPHNIGLGAANDEKMIEIIALATAKEIQAAGLDWNFAPTVAVARNDHWGRTYESYAETPEIVSKLATGYVKGMQGNFGDENVIGCVKHWIGDGATLHGIDRGNAEISIEELKEIHLPPYKAAIEAGVLSIMVSLSGWYGHRCHGHKYLITDLLKNECNFEGLVITDWDGINNLNEDYYEASIQGINAGIDMFMISEKWKEFISNIIRAVGENRVSLARIDDAVRRVLAVKFKADLFDKPSPKNRRLSLDKKIFGGKVHREIARDAVRKSLVLLKNEENILPLKKDTRILVAGKNADNRGHQCGGFTVEWQGVLDNDSIVGGTSIWEGIKAVCPNAEFDLEGKTSDSAKHDVAIVVIGETPYAEVMGDLYNDGLSNPDSPEDEEKYGTNLYNHELHPEDIQTIRNIREKGVPVVTILISGRPLVIEKELPESKAVVAAWLPGSEGQGVADVIFGDYNFSGKLTFSWPCYDNENWNVGDEGYNPLFPYGYGLEY